LASYPQQEVTAMTDHERAALIKLLQEQSQFHAANPAAAREFLLGTGIYTPEGNLTPEYGGPAPEPKAEQQR
jgi:hypothetical protein